MKRRFWIGICLCFSLLSGLVLLIGVQAQAPQQAQIAFSAFIEGNWEIVVTDENGQHMENLSNNPAGDSGPSWSPDRLKQMREIQYPEVSTL